MALRIIAAGGLEDRSNVRLEYGIQLHQHLLYPPNNLPIDTAVCAGRAYRGIKSKRMREDM